MTTIVLPALTTPRRSHARRRGLATCALLALGVLLLVACGARTKEDLVARTRDVTTRADLEHAIGKPDDITKVGPVETWTYRASNGRVVFVIVGDKVTLQTAGPDDHPR